MVTHMEMAVFLRSTTLPIRGAVRYPQTYGYPYVRITRFNLELPISVGEERVSGGHHRPILRGGASASPKFSGCAYTL